MLSGKTVVVGVTGGIAAYKAAELVRWLKKQDAAVICVMTPAAEHFVSALTLETLSANPVVTSLWQPSRPLDLGSRPPDRRSPVEHIEIADAADLVIVAPATADFLARASLGIADDVLTATVLATRAPQIYAPAMNVNMWNHPATREHVERLRSRGIGIVAPEEGELACRWEGRGRLAGIEVLTEAITRSLSTRGRTGKGKPRAAGNPGPELTPPFAGREVVVAAGPTQEALDPVRYISNHSSGRMGYAIAEAARDRGARVTLVAGPTALEEPHGVTVIPVTTAEEMERAVHRAARTADAVVMAAAVADYRPARRSRKKLPRRNGKLEMALESTPDILQGVPRRLGRVIVGFALETGDGLANARRKLRQKNADLIVLNDPTRRDSQFGGETNRVTLVSGGGGADELPTMTKREVAERIWDRVARLWESGEPGIARSPATRRTAARKTTASKSKSTRKTAARKRVGTSKAAPKSARRARTGSRSKSKKLSRSRR